MLIPQLFIGAISDAFAPARKSCHRSLKRSSAVKTAMTDLLTVLGSYCYRLV